MSSADDKMATNKHANEDSPGDDGLGRDITVSEDIERLIVRRLDGELTDEQSLALDRELLRCPQARAMFDAYSRVDALAGAAVRDIASNDETPAVAVTEAGARRGFADRAIRFDRRRARPSHRWMWVASAAAACLALVVFWQTPADRTGGGDTVAGWPSPTTQNHTNHAPIPPVGYPGGDVGVFNAADIAPPPVNRQTNRNYYFVPNKNDGRIYLLSVDHIRELVEPEGAADGSRRWDPI